MIRTDPLGRRAYIVDVKWKKPSQFRGDYKVCPFCHEELTPQEVWRDKEEWRVRIIPNKYPMGKHNYVIIHRDHYGDIDEPSYMEELRKAVGVMWDYKNKHKGWLLVFKNHGYLSGASMKHAHEQAILVEESPVKDERGLGKYIEDELSSERAITEYAFAPYASIQSYEVWIVIEDMVKGDYTRICPVYRAIRKILGKFDYNLVFYYSEEGHFPPFISLIPRLGIIGGAELGTLTLSSKVSPERAAKEIREKLKEV